MAEESQVSFDVAEFGADIKRGALKLLRLQSEHFQIVQNQFDRKTGARLSPSLVPMNRAGVTSLKEGFTAQIEQLRKGVAGCDDILAEMDRLDQTEAAQP